MGRNQVWLGFAVPPCRGRANPECAYASTRARTDQRSNGAAMNSGSLVTAFACVTLLALAAFHDPALAQNTTSGALTGTITDSSGAIVPAARVELRENTKGSTQAAATDTDGRYSFPFLRPGSYSVTVTKKDFAPAKIQVDVFVGPAATLNVVLFVASGTIDITVSAQRPLLDAENGDSAATLVQREISAVPNPGNDLTYLAQTAPGEVMNTDGGYGNFSAFGMPGVSNLFTLNGMSYNNVGPSANTSGALNLLLGNNQVQEATVVSYAYSAQFGGAAGANVNYVTRSGGNAWHGNATYGWNGRVLNANDWINNATGVKRPFDNVNQWAAAVGGPIKRDKVFFFFNTEGVRLILPTTPFTIQLPSPDFQAATLANIGARFGPNSASDSFYRQIFALYNRTPGAGRALPGDFAGTLGCEGFAGPNGLGSTVPCAVHFDSTRSAPDNEALFSGRIDWNLHANDRAFLLVQYDHGHQAAFLDPINSVFDVASDQPWWQGQVTETHTFSGNAANQFLLAGWYLGSTFQQRNPGQTLAAFPTVLAWENSGSPFTNLGGFDNALPQGINFTHYQVADDLMKTRGNHKMAAGISFLAEDWTTFRYSQNAIGLLAPLTVDAFYQGGVDPGVLNGSDQNPDFTVLSQSFSSIRSSRLHFAEFGVYGQDEWHIRPNLSFSLGLRAEHQANPTCQQRCFVRLVSAFDQVSHDPSVPYNQVIAPGQKRAFEAMDSILWMPRASFAWQPRGVSHNTVLRGGIGLFYDLMPPNLAVPFSRNAPVLNSFTSVDNNLAPGETASLFRDTAASNSAFLNGFAAGQTLAQIQAAIAAPGTVRFNPPALTLPAATMHAAQYQKWSLELQQTLGASTFATIGYYGHHGVHEIVQNGSANAFGFGTLPSGLCASPPVPPCADPRFGVVTVSNTPGISNYNAMVISVTQRWAQGVVRGSYSWSHGFDEASNDGLQPFLLNSGASPLQPQDPRDLRASYGPAEYDVRHRSEER